MATTMTTPEGANATNGVATFQQPADANAPANAAPSTFRGLYEMHRAFPTRDLFRPRAVWSLLWALASTLVLACVLVVTAIMLHLLATGGSMSLNSAAAKQCNELTGITVNGPHGNLGLRPVVWAARDTIWRDSLAAVYRSVPWLQSNWTAWTLLLLLTAALFIAWRVLTLVSRLAALKAAADVSDRLRRSLHRQALRVGPGDLSEEQQGVVRGMFTLDVERIRSAVARRVHGFGIGISRVAVLVLLAIAVDWRTALQCLVPLACCWYLFVRQFDRLRLDQRTTRQQMDNERSSLAEGLSKSRIIRGYGMENVEHRLFQNSLQSYRGKVLQANRRAELHRLAAWGLAILAAGIALFFIGIKVLINDGEAAGLSFASAVFLLTIFGLLYRPLDLLRTGRAEWVDASTSAHRIFQYLDRIPDVSQAVGAKFLQPLSSSLQFEGVQCVDQEQKPLLKGVDLKLKAGKTIAFVSVNPLEARALAYLLPRFVEPKTGRVLVDGEDIAWVTLESLRAETAYVGGEAPWFSGTVLENIRCGDDHRSLQEVTEAAKTVHAHKFITHLPKGYETVLGNHSLKLNTGEAFRLALARAVLQKPALLIIEEPTGKLDEDSKSLIDDAYNRILDGRTVIFLPARLSTVRRVDTVVLLHHGKVEAIGKHQSLVKASPVYRHWEYSRFNQFRSEEAT